MSNSIRARVSSLKEWLSRFAATLCYLPAGAGFLYFSAILEKAEHVLMSAIAHELGVALFVSVFVTIAFDRLVKGAEFSETLRSLSGLAGRLKRMIRNVSPTELSDVKRTLGAYLYDMDKKYIESLSEVIHGVATINQLPDPEATAYLPFVNWQLKHTARQLTGLRRVLRGDDDGAYKFPPMDDRLVASKILEAQMRCINDQQTYLSLTSFKMYGPMSTSYMEATIAACDRGLKIRRIFNVVGESHTMSDAVKKQYREVIEKQRNIQNIEIRFLHADLTSNQADLGHLISLAGFGRSVDKLFFGQFISNQNRRLFSAEKIHDNISNLTLSNSSETPDPIEWLFEKLWEIASQDDDFLN